MPQRRIKRKKRSLFGFLWGLRTLWIFPWTLIKMTRFSTAITLQSSTRKCFPVLKEPFTFSFSHPARFSAQHWWVEDHNLTTLQAFIKIYCNTLFACVSHCQWRNIQLVLGKLAFIQCSFAIIYILYEKDFCYCCFAVFFRHIKLVQQLVLLIFTNAPSFPQLRFQYNR